MSDSALDCELAGARLCATHQPQRIGKIQGIQRTPAVSSGEMAATGPRHSRAPGPGAAASVFRLTQNIVLTQRRFAAAMIGDGGMTRPDGPLTRNP